MLEILRKKRQEGFTLVELLIVIVIIAILAALVIVTFSGVQQRARNTERQTDISAVAKYLEIYFTNESHYPLQADIVEPELPADVKSNLAAGGASGLDVAALAAPGQTGNSFAGAAAANQNQYGYQAWQSDGSTTCTTEETCLKYTLSWWEEAASNNLKTKLSSN